MLNETSTFVSNSTKQYKGGNMLDRKPLTTFIILVFLISWPLFLVPLAFKDAAAQTRQIVTTVAFALTMWGPGIAAIIATLTSGGSFRDLNLRRLGPKRFYLWAWLLFPILTIVSSVATVLFGISEFDPNFTAINDMLPASETLNPTLIVAAQLGAALTIIPLFNTLFAMGEELGWRGFLLPKLLPLGQWKAILISNIIWGVWHAPAIVQGLNYPGYPIAGIFMMVAFSLLLGTILSWLYLNTKSPWTPALAHGSVNAVAGLPVLAGFDCLRGVAGRFKKSSCLQDGLGGFP
ncbi:MAG: lysostaphin resistance A-like protein [Planctomycetota bacterium]|jgi:membrane protease YdiL (CAAX protease family)